MNKMVLLAYSELLIALLSAFTTIVGYTNMFHVYRSFNLLDFLSANAGGFGDFVFSEYRGTVYIYYRQWQIILLVMVSVAALVCAVVGLMRLSNQTDNKLSFILTILGLVGTMAPSLIIFILIVALKDNYLGKITCGIYPVLSPLAMMMCIAAAAQMRKKNEANRKRMIQSEGLLRHMGDL